MSKVEKPRTNDASDALPSLLHISEVLCQSELEVSPDSSQEPTWSHFKDMAEMLQPLADIWHWPDGLQDLPSAESAESASAETEHELHELHELHQAASAAAAATAATAATAQSSQEIDSECKEIDDAATKAACTSPVRAVKSRISCVPTHQRLDSLASTYLPESEAKFDGRDNVKPQPQSNPSQDDADEHVKEDGRDNGYLQCFLGLSGCNSSCCACAEMEPLEPLEPVSFATWTWPTWPTWAVCCQTPVTPVTPVTEAEAGAVPA